MNRMCRMFSAWMTLFVFSMLTASEASGGMEDAKLAAHWKAKYTPTKTIPSPCDIPSTVTIEPNYSPNWNSVTTTPNPLPCSQYTTDTGLLGPSTIYIVVGHAGLEGVAGVSFGIDYNGRSGMANGIEPSFAVFTPCADGLLFPTDGGFGPFPAPKGGTRVTWAAGSCQTQEIGGEGVHAVVGSIYTYAYAEDVLEITPNNSMLGGPELFVADCVGVSTSLPMTPAGTFGSHLGAVGIGFGSTGFNPCVETGPPPFEMVSAVATGFSVNGQGQISTLTDQIEVQFTNDVGLGADIPSNYAISNTAATVVAAAVDGLDPTLVHLTLSTPVGPSAAFYEVTASGIEDVFGQVIVNDGIVNRRAFFLKAVEFHVDMSIFLQSQSTPPDVFAVEGNLPPLTASFQDNAILLDPDLDRIYVTTAPFVVPRDEGSGTAEATLLWRASHNTVGLEPRADRPHLISSANGVIDLISVYWNDATTVEDLAPPVMESAAPVGFLIDASGQVATTTNQIDVRFSEPVAGGASTPSNYTIANTAATVVSATVDPGDAALIHLVLSAPIGPSTGFYAVSAYFIQDIAGNNITTSSDNNRKDFALKSLVVQADMSAFLAQSSSPPDTFWVEGELSPFAPLAWGRVPLLDPDLDEIFTTEIPVAIPRVPSITSPDFTNPQRGIALATLDWNLVHNTSGMEPRPVRHHDVGLPVAEGIATDTLAVTWGEPDFFIWTRQFGLPVSTTLVYAIAVSPDGVFVAGTVPDPGNVQDASLRRFDLSGNQLWTTTFGTLQITNTIANSHRDYATDVAVFGDGVYVCGHVGGALPGASSFGNQDAYLRKYNLDGDLIWTRTMGTSGLDQAAGLVADATGVYVVVTLDNSSDPDLLLRKYDPDGAELWTAQLTTADVERAIDVAMGPEGLLVLIEHGTAGGFLTGRVAKYDLDGNPGSVSSTGLRLPRGIAVNSSGFYVAGTSQTANGFAARLNAYTLGGSLRGVMLVDSSGSDFGSAVAADPNGVYFSGSAGATLPGQPGPGAFFAVYDPDGNEASLVQDARFSVGVIYSGYEGVFLAGGAGTALPGQTGGSAFVSFRAEDLSPPRVVSATATGFPVDAQGQIATQTAQVDVSFSEPVGIGADIAANYTIDHSILGVMPSIQSAAVDAGDPALVHLTLSSPIGAVGYAYGLTVQALMDTYGNPIAQSGSNETGFAIHQVLFQGNMNGLLAQASTPPDTFWVEGDLLPLTLTPGDNAVLLDPDGDGVYRTIVPISFPYLESPTLQWRFRHSTAGLEPVLDRELELFTLSVEEFQVYEFWADQIPGFTWTRRFGTSGTNDSAQGLDVDATGAFTCGRVGGALPGETFLGSHDAFLRKFDLDGNEVWTRQFGTPDSDVGSGVCLGQDGVYVVGSTYGALPGQVWSGALDVFIRKYDFAGNELWTRQFGPVSSSVEPNFKICAFGGDIYLTGSVSIALPGQTHFGDSDVYLRKYDSDGNEVWTRQFGTSGLDEGRTVIADSTGVYVAGETRLALPGQTDLDAGGPLALVRSDVFLRKYDHDGNEIWTRQLGTAANDYVRDSARFGSSVYLTGYTEGSLPGQASAGDLDVYYLEIDTAGSVRAGRQTGTVEADQAYGIVAGFNGIFLAGYSSGMFPGDPPEVIGPGAFLLRFDHSGALTSAIQPGGVSSYQALASNETALFLAGMGSYKALAVRAFDLPEGDLDGDGLLDTVDGCPFQTSQPGEVDRDYDGCPDETSSFRFVRFWTEEQLPLSFETDGEGHPDIADGSDFSELDAAFAQWTSIPGVTLAGGDDGLRAGPSNPSSGDQRNSLSFRDQDGFLFGTIAITPIAVALDDTTIGGQSYRAGQIVDADILFNTRDFRFSTPTFDGGSSAFDLRSVAVHEFGHFCGFSHTPVERSTMFYVVPRGTAAASLEADDAVLALRGYGAAPPQLSVEGRILRPDGASPIVGAAVFAMSAAGDTIQMTFSGPDGIYRLYDLTGDITLSTHPLDGSGEVNGLTPPAVNSVLAEHVEVDFLPEYWNLVESNGDFGAAGDPIATGAGPVTGVDIVTNRDSTAPEVASTTPAQGEAAAPAVGAILVEFNEKLDIGAFAGNPDIALRNVSTGTGVAGSAAILRKGDLLVFTPGAPLTYDTDYELTVGPELLDLSGNPMVAGLTVQFHTELQPLPSLTSLTPSAGPVGGQLVIAGRGFDPNPAANQVLFGGGVAATPVAATLDRLTIAVPAGADSGDVTVIVGGNTSNGLPFDVLPPREPPVANVVDQTAFFGTARTLDVSSDGAQAFVATSEGVVIVDAFPGSSTFLEQRVVSIPGGVEDVVSLPVGNLALAIGSAPEMLHLIDATTATAIQEFELPDAPLRIEVVPGGNEVVIVYPDRVALYSTTPGPLFGQEIRQWTAPSSSFLGDITVSATGMEVYATTADGDVAVLGLGAQEEIVAVLDAGTTPREIAASPDGSSFMVVDADGTARLYASRGPLLESYTVDGGFSALTYSPEGDYAFATNLVLNDVEVLNTTEGSLVGEDMFPTQVDPRDVETGSGGQFVYVLSGEANVLQVFDTQSGPRIRRISPSSGGTGTLLTVSGSGFDPVAANNTVSIGGVVHTPLEANASGTRLLVRQLAVAGSGAVTVTAGGLASNSVPYRVVNRPDPGSLFAIGDQSTGTAQPLTRLLEVPGGGLLAGLHADGTLIALQADPALDNLLRPIDVLSPAQSQLLGDGPMAFSPDSRKLFVGSGSEVAVFRVVTGLSAPLARLGSITQSGSIAVLDPAELALTPDGQRLVVRSAGGLGLHEVDVATHEVLGTVTGFTASPTAMAVDPRGSRLFVGENAGGAPVIRVIDLDPASPTYRGILGTLNPSGSEGPFQLFCSPDGHWLYVVTALASGGNLDSRLGVLDIDPGAGFGQLIETVSLALEPMAARILPNRSGTLVYVLRRGAEEIGAVDAVTLAHLPETAAVTGLGAASDLVLSRDDARLLVPSGSDRFSLVDVAESGVFDLVSGFNQLGVAGVPLAAPLVIQVKAGTGDLTAGSLIRFRGASGGGNFGFPDQQSFGVVDAGGFASASYIPGLVPGQDMIEILSASGTVIATINVVSDTAGAPPEIVSVRPGPGTVLDPGVTTRVSVDFSKGIDPATVGSLSFQLRPTGGTALAGFYTFADEGRRAVFTPAAPLDPGTGYEFQVTSGILDGSGNPLANPGTFGFSTAAFPPLLLQAADPPAGGVGIPIVLSGQGFSPDPAANHVLFEGGLEARIADADPGAIVTSVPLGTTSGLVRVVANSDTSEGIPFAVLVPPPLPVLDVTGEVSVPASGQQIAILPDGSRAYMTSAGTNAVVPIRIADLTTEEPISTGSHPFGVAASPGGDRIYVTNFYSNTISVIDTDPERPTFHTVVASIHAALNPTAIAAHPDGRSLYVVHYGESTLMIVDTDPASATEYQARSTVDTGSGSKSVTVTPDGGLVVVGVSTGILVLNASDGSARSTVDTGSGSKAVTVTPDGAFALVLTEDERLVLIDIQPGSPTEGQARSTVDTGSGSKSVTVSPDGGFAYVTREDGFVDVFQIQITGGAGAAVEAPGFTSPITLVFVGSVEVGENPIGIAFDPSGSGLILVVNSGSLTITVLNGPDVTPTLAALVDVDPNALNLNSNGQYLIAYVQFDVGIDPDKVAVSTVRMESVVAADTSYGELVDNSGDGILERSLRFPRSEVTAVLPSDQDSVRVEVTGIVDGLEFAGADSIRLLRPKRWRPASGDVVEPGSTTEVAWTPIDTTAADRVDIFFSSDGGDNWEPVAETSSQDTTYNWTVPEVLSSRAKLLLVARDSRRAGVNADGSLAGVEGYDGLDSPFFIDKVSTVAETLPLRFAVRPPFPNPSAGRTQLRFELPEAQRVSVRVYAVDGSLVRQLLNEAPYPAGRHTVVWDGADARGQRISSGVFFVRVTTGKHVGIQKIIRLQ